MNQEKSRLKVSVAMITYNHESYINQAIDSILKQDANFIVELVIGEDFSTDQTRKICEEYANRYPQIIKLLPSVKNLGVTSNFARTLLACTGSYIAVCEGDDYWTDVSKLQKQVDFLETNRDFVACFHSVKVIDSNNNISKARKNSILYNRDVTALQMISGKVLSLSSLCFRNVLTEFPEEFYKSPTGDNFLSSLLGNYGNAKYMDDIEPSAYRMHDGGIWSLKTETQKKMTLLSSYFWIWQYYERIGKPEFGRPLFNKILLEGFYSNPHRENNPGMLNNTEMAVVQFVRKTFRVLRWVSNRIEDFFFGIL